MSLAMQSDHGLSARATCRVLKPSHSAVYYRPRPRNDEPVVAAVSAHITDNPGHGFGLLYKTLRANQPPCGKTRLWRVYRELKLNRPRRGKKRLPARIREPLIVPPVRNDTWSADFMADALWSGRRFAPSTSLTTTTARRCASRSIPVCRLLVSSGRSRS